MKYLGIGLLGVIGFILSQSLVTHPLTLPLQAFLIWGSLFLIFFGHRQYGTALLIGTIIGMELWGDRHFGLAAFLGVGIYNITDFFSRHIRLTAPLNRFLMVWLLSLFLTLSYLYPWVDLKKMITPGVLIYVVGCAGAISLVSWRNSDPYEML